MDRGVDYDSPRPLYGAMVRGRVGLARRAAGT